MKFEEQNSTDNEIENKTSIRKPVNKKRNVFAESKIENMNEVDSGAYIFRLAFARED